MKMSAASNAPVFAKQILNNIVNRAVPSLKDFISMAYLPLSVRGSYCPSEIHWMAYRINSAPSFKFNFMRML
jgi:hypothetical protein